MVLATFAETKVARLPGRNPAFLVNVSHGGSVMESMGYRYYWTAGGDECENGLFSVQTPIQYCNQYGFLSLFWTAINAYSESEIRGKSS